jgi:hypothetical protein
VRDAPDWVEACHDWLVRAEAELERADRRFVGARVTIEHSLPGARSLAQPTDRVVLRLATPDRGSFELRVERGVSGLDEDPAWRGYDGESDIFRWRQRGQREGRIEVIHAPPELGRRFGAEARDAADQCLALGADPRRG